MKGSLTSFVSSALLALTACEDDHPYTPFQVASALPSAPTAAVPPVPSPTTPPPPFNATPPVIQPKGKEWRVQNQVIKAPAGYQFERALQADFDADGSQEIVAWAAPIDDPLKRAELWLYPATGNPKKLFSLPGFVPTGPTCTVTTALTHTGPKTVTVDSRAACEARMIARAPNRSIAVVAPRAERPLVLMLRAADGGTHEDFRLNVSSLDQDADGRDDVTLSATMTERGAGPQPVTGRFVWYDREAGASRDDSEPGVSFAQVASQQLLRAKGKSTSPTVRAAVQNLKRLYGAVCEEAGTPRLFDAEGNALSCGRLTTTFSRAAEAEITSLLKQDEVLEAFGVLVRDGWFDHESDPKELERRLNLFGKDLTRRKSRVDRDFSVALPNPGSLPSFSPLEFAGEHQLLVETKEHVRRYSFDGVEQSLQAGAEPPQGWPLKAGLPGQRMWTGVVYSCDRAEVTLSFVDGVGHPLPAQPTDILAPRPGTCRGGPAPATPPPVPVGWVGDEIVAWVAGSWVGPKTPTFRPQGSPRSQNGAWSVYPTELGLLVTGKQNQLWKYPDGFEAKMLSGCVIQNSGQLVACATARGVVLIKPTN